MLQMMSKLLCVFADGRFMSGFKVIAGGRGEGSRSLTFPVAVSEKKKADLNRIKGILWIASSSFSRG